MFTGIIECLGKVEAVEQEGQNVIFTVSSEISDELSIDQSVSHNGACLTITKQENGRHQVAAVHETLEKTNLGELKVGDWVNLERSMVMNGRIDGHIVQGHVDQVGVCTSVLDEEGSWRFSFEHQADKKNFTVEKGSICINGTSLTVVNSGQNSFEVAIIPYTYEHTTFKHLKEGSKVNLEFDIIGKYLQKMFEQYNS